MGCLLKPIIGIIKWILMIIGLITLIVAIVIGVAVWQLTKTPALEGEMHPVSYTAADAVAFDAAVEDLEDWLADPLIPVGTSTTLRLTEKMVTAKVVEAIEDAGIQLDLSDIWVNLTVNEEGDQVIQLLGKFDLGFITLTAGLELEMYVENGEPKITLSEVALGSGFGIPDQIKDVIADAIPTDEALIDMIKVLSIDITGIQIGNGQLIFTGKKTLGI